MSESFPANHEHSREAEEAKSEPHQPERHSKHEKHQERVAEKQNSIDEILQKIEKEANSTENLLTEVIKEEKEAGEEASIPVNSSLKDHALHQGLRKIQRELPATQRAFSKVVHQPIIEQVSDVTSETIARPSGLLFGGIFSVIASTGVLIICRYYGYEYNFMIGLLAFVGGFICGISLEGVSSATRRAKGR